LQLIHSYLDKAFKTTMLKFTLLALLAVGAFASPNPRPRLDGRVVGGENAEQGEFPHQVSVEIFGSHACGGSLISETAVLTAAHCCAYTIEEVVVGEHRLNANDGTEQRIRVSRQTANPDYNSGTLDGDVCVLNLATAAVLGDGVDVIALPAAFEEYTAGEMLTTTGWGTTSEGGNLANTLQKVDVPFVDDEECDDAYSSFGGITPGMLCAGFPNGGADACQGDSGGPITDAKNGLVGVVSWGYGCARPNYPGVYAQTSHFIEFISQTAGF
jgi:trypsin